MPGGSAVLFDKKLLQDTYVYDIIVHTWDVNCSVLKPLLIVIQVNPKGMWEAIKLYEANHIPTAVVVCYYFS